MRIFIFIVLLVSGCKTTKYGFVTRCLDATVVEIGGCSGRYAMCAVRLSDGSRQTMETPLIGDKYCKTSYEKILE